MMDLSEKWSGSTKCQCLLLVVGISLLLFVIPLSESTSSYSQNSSPSSSSINQTSIPSVTSSERLGPPLIISEAQRQGTTSPGQQQQQQYSLYENPKEGFSIQYPSDWSLRQGGEAGVIATFSSPSESNFDPFTANLVIGVENLTSGASLDNYTRTVVSLLQSQPPGAHFNLTGSPVATTFGGIPAQRMGFTMTVPNDRSLTSETNVEGIQVWTVDNNTAYVLSFAAEQDKFAGYLPVIEHIIGTFQITPTVG